MLHLQQITGALPLALVVILLAPPAPVDRGGIRSGSDCRVLLNGFRLFLANIAA